MLPPASQLSHQPALPPPPPQQQQQANGYAAREAQSSEVRDSGW